MFFMNHLQNSEWTFSKESLPSTAVSRPSEFSSFCAIFCFDPFSNTRIIAEKVIAISITIFILISDASSIGFKAISLCSPKGLVQLHRLDQRDSYPVSRHFQRITTVRKRRNRSPLETVSGNSQVLRSLSFSVTTSSRSSHSSNICKR
jgi:hypothetical protein